MVIVIGFDASYYKFYAKDASPQTVSNAMYVALTRAKEKLVLIKDSRSKHIPFLKLDVLLSPVMRPFVEIHDGAKTQAPSQARENKMEVETLSVTELCDLPNRAQYHDRLATLLHFKNLSRASGCRKDEGALLETGKEYNTRMDITEDTSCINGLVLPLFYALQRYPEARSSLKNCRAAPALKEMRTMLKNDVANKLYKRLDEIVSTLEDSALVRETVADPCKMLLLGSLLHCYREKTFFTLSQLPEDFSWLPAACFSGGEQRLHTVLQRQTS